MTDIPPEVVIKENILAAQKLANQIETHLDKARNKMNWLHDKLGRIDDVIASMGTTARMAAATSLDSFSALPTVMWPALQTRLSSISTRDIISGSGHVELFDATARLFSTSSQDVLAAIIGLSAPANQVAMAMQAAQDIFMLSSTVTINFAASAVSRQDELDAVVTNTTPPTGVGLANPSAGFNFGGVAYWQSAHPFLNLVKASGEWIGHRAGQWGGIPQSEVNAVLDADGWPTSLPADADHLGLIVVHDAPSDPLMAGQFRVRWTGTPNFSINGGPRILSGTETTITVNQGGSIMLDLYGAGIRDLSIVPVRHVAAYDNGELFNPDYIALIRNFRTIRFMNWQRINGDNNEGNQTVTWAQRTKESNYSWATSAGCPPGVMIKLANRIGADPWFCMPHLADDNYVRQFAILVRDMLDPRLRAFVEYANEVWNIGMFGQAKWVRARALELWPSATWEWMQLYGGYFVRIAKIWREVFVGQEHRIRPTLSSQTGQTDFMADAMDAPLWTPSNTDGNKKPHEYADVFAVTSYIGYGLGSDDYAQELLDIRAASGEAAALNRAFEILQAEVDGLPSRFTTYRNMIETRGMKMVMYEGGSHASAVGSWTENPTLVDLLAKVARDTRMGTLYTEMLNHWKAAGGEAFCLFTDVEMATKHGSWGHINRLSDRTPRWNAVMDWNVANPGYWETRDPAAFYDH